MKCILPAGLVIALAGCGKGAIEDPAGLTCGNESPSTLTACISPSNYRSDVEFIGTAREPGSPHWQQVQDLCAKRFADAGFQVEREAFTNGTYSGINVIGVRPGTTKANERVLLSAHYDHLANGCPGADDNASGVGGVFESARVLAMGRYERTLVVACWDQHENGLYGSQEYTERARARGENIVASLVFEMIAFRSEAPNSQSIPAGLDLLFPEAFAQMAANQNRADFVAIVSDAHANDDAALLARFSELTSIPTIQLQLPDDELQTPVFHDLRRSDHSRFWDAGYPAVMITDTASLRNPAYHCQNGVDQLSSLDFDFAVSIVRATAGATADALGWHP